MSGPSVTPPAPIGAGPATPATGASPYLAKPRGPSSRDELKIDWQHPVFGAPAAADGSSRAIPLGTALDLESAFARLAGDDARPLLVLRECPSCNGTDDALLTRQTDNERTLLTSRWFHCVKLAPDVVTTNHPLAALFPGESPPHLFVAQADGTGRIDLRGDQSRTELWKALDASLAAAYADKVDPSLRTLAKLLDRMDELDERLSADQREFEKAIESDGPDARRTKKLAKTLEALRAERSDLRAQAVSVSALKLRPREEGGEEKATGAGGA